VSGDRVAVEGARKHLPWAIGVVIKEPIGRYAADSVSPATAQTMLRAAASDAIGQIDRARLFRFESPIRLDVEMAGTQNADFVELMPGIERTGPRSVRFVHDDYNVVFRTFVAA